MIKEYCKRPDNFQAILFDGSASSAKEISNWLRVPVTLVKMEGKLVAHIKYKNQVLFIFPSRYVKRDRKDVLSMITYDELYDDYDEVQ